MTVTQLINNLKRFCENYKLDEDNTQIKIYTSNDVNGEAWWDPDQITTFINKNKETQIDINLFG